MTKLNTRELYAAQAAKHDGKVHGAWPSNVNFEQAHTLVRSPGTKTAFALAMYLRNKGATTNVISTLNDGPYLNRMRELIGAKRVKRVPMATDAGHTVYRIELADAPKADAKPAPKAKAKASTARKRKPASKAKADTAATQ